MRPPTDPEHDAFHAHVYFDESTVDKALELTEEAGRQFGVPLGRLHRKNVGPHPNWSRQLSFDAKIYRELIDWLDERRGGLTILVHGLTGDDYADHTQHAWWLGEPAELDLSIFKD